MKIFLHRKRSRKGVSGLSLIEIMVSVALLSVIILGLLGMFNQTQKAFRGGLAQVDVLDSTRAALEMMVRELEQTSVAGGEATNLMANIPTGFPPLVLTGTQITNVLQEYFFLTKSNNYYIGTGYLVTKPNVGAGTLYRFSARTNIHFTPAGLYTQFKAATTNNGGLGRVAEGIVHLRVRAFDRNGDLYLNTNSPSVLVQRDLNNIAEQSFIFRSNALPSFVELEFGILEAQVSAQIKPMPAAAATSFLQNQAGRIHLFRQRIPIRTAVP